MNLAWSGSWTRANLGVYALLSASGIGKVDGSQGLSNLILKASSDPYFRRGGGLARRTGGSHAGLGRGRGREGATRWLLLEGGELLLPDPLVVDFLHGLDDLAEEGDLAFGISLLEELARSERSSYSQVSE